MTAAEQTAVRRRGAAVEATVLDTTIALLVERGSAIAVDEVAEASGVHKTTIYRRYPTRELLIAAAIRRLGETAVPAVVDADPRAAVLQLARSVAGALRSPQGGNILRAVMAASAASPELVAFADDFFRDRYALATEHLARLAAAGGLRADVDPVVVWEQIVNPMHVRALCGRATSDAEAEQLVELALRGAAV
ncbi:TetR/AcrR family transcriptional regulator C-terminal ligand-binding domain-containing protein [Microcella daejeonensis]|uniref:TetR/AcrR family transcriptional regulator C-terminal ligand-binding domain-containing protein n=1 Tax=Microcella daejeonensis TaxID=2994971 RepID=A0A9E8S9X9_9MICO|nr:TetR/AcrR family transcriptional regulator [Microcella daejeonensis]WAB81996.1 TetR/AcrR family transcriptional regulator C-terminal ligand-binding domain-containing protein [Microcella daejeonensis]WAB84165.1 TetR/AcrR family transcriptional regulator C-terminal ligand-binding domain-containing protein [Microcella daejeonensis]